jgi:hypothetical protein
MMGDIHRLVRVLANAAGGVIQALGMQAENQKRLSRGEALAYGEAEFESLVDARGLDFASVNLKPWALRSFDDEGNTFFEVTFEDGEPALAHYLSATRDAEKSGGNFELKHEGRVVARRMARAAND